MAIHDGKRDFDLLGNILDVFRNVANPICKMREIINNKNSRKWYSSVMTW